MSARCVLTALTLLTAVMALGEGPPGLGEMNRAYSGNMSVASGEQEALPSEADDNEQDVKMEERLVEEQPVEEHSVSPCVEESDSD